MLNDNQLENLLPPDIAFKYKLAIKSLVINGASFEDVCIGCGIDTAIEVETLLALLQRFNYHSRQNTLQ
jgi:hypothetical protein